MQVKGSSIASTLAISALCFISSAHAADTAPAASAASTRTIKAQVWVDNWFALYSGNTLIKEDSVPYNTEMSFNTESFTFNTTLPAQLSVIMKDYKENDTGLEYIGSRRQQAGDGGFIAQFVDAKTNEVLAVSNEGWRCTTIHRAPLNLNECERSSNPAQSCKSKIDPEPSDWKSPSFDSSSWPNAIVHSIREVQPHGDYGRYSWQPSAKFIWSSDIVVDNTVLCRFTLPASSSK